MTAPAAAAAAAPPTKHGFGFLLEPDTYGRLVPGDCFTTMAPPDFLREWSSQRDVLVQLFTGRGAGVLHSAARVYRIIFANAAIRDRERGAAT